jgi:hypothetical protein
MPNMPEEFLDKKKKIIIITPKERKPRLTEIK